MRAPQAGRALFRPPPQGCEALRPALRALRRLEPQHAAGLWSAPGAGAIALRLGPGIARCGRGVSATAIPRPACPGTLPNGTSPANKSIPRPLIAERARILAILRQQVTPFTSSARPPRAMVTGSGGSDGAGPKKYGVLFVCLGNICRSPSAEAVFRHLVEKEGLQNSFHIDSAGTIGFHEGKPADSRSIQHAAKRGINVTSISRPLRPSDFAEFDLILAMDKENLSDIKMSFQTWSKRHSLPSDGLSKVQLMCDYCKRFKYDEVPDPYYGGSKGFDLVLDLLEDACSELLKSLKSKLHS